MDVLIYILKFGGTIVGGALAGIVLVVVGEVLTQLVKRVARRIRRARRSVEAPPARLAESEPAPASPPTPRFAHVLLVEADEDRDTFSARIELATNIGLRCGRLRLEVLDDNGSVRVQGEGPLPASAGLTRAQFERSSPPVDATVAEMLSWRWDVVVLDENGERARWREHLTGPDRIDAEAEIMLAPGTPQPVQARLDANAPEDDSFEGLVRLLRRAAALAHVDETI